jgi:hypothetical protein
MEDNVDAKIVTNNHSIPDGLFFPTLESKRLRPLIRMTQQLTGIYHEINRVSTMSPSPSVLTPCVALVSSKPQSVIS